MALALRQFAFQDIKLYPLTLRARAAILGAVIVNHSGLLAPVWSPVKNHMNFSNACDHLFDAHILQMAEPPEDPSLYKSLNTSGSIRLLKLSASHNPCMREVKGELRTFCLADPDCPPFTAVSYTWGDGTAYSNLPVQLGNHQTRALQSVLPLLHMLCSNTCGDFDLEEDWFWIDSICINQNDFEERASQVKLMGQIYRQARTTIVWLAEETPDTDQAIDFLSHLAQRRSQLRQEWRKHGKRIPPDLIYHPGWRPLERLLSLPWWRRVWTLQEFILARDLKFYCGSKSISCRDFRKGIHAIELCSPNEAHIKAHVWKTAWNRRRLIQWYEPEHRKDRASLISLMTFCGDYQATDPRDRIWAVYGLAREEDRQMIGHPTYRYDVKTLYTELAKSYVDKYKSLDIVCYAQLFRSREPDWPSWLPDWRVEAQPLIVPIMASQSTDETLANFRPITRAQRLEGRAPTGRPKILYKAAGEQPPIPQSWSTPDHLACRGFLIDYIDGLGGIEGIDTAQDSQSSSPTNTTAVNSHEISSLREVVARSLALDRQDQHLESLAPVQRFSIELQQLAAACEDQGEVYDTKLRFLRKWWRVNRDLRIRGFTLRDICRIEDWYASPNSTRKLMPRASKSLMLRLRGIMKKGFRRIAVTTEGHVGVAPKGAQKGDLVCVLFGCSVPVVLRKCEQCDFIEPMYELIGEGYLDGFMNGEALGLTKEAQDFNIR